MKKTIALYMVGLVEIVMEYSDERDEMEYTGKPVRISNPLTVDFEMIETESVKAQKLVDIDKRIEDLLIEKKELEKDMEP